MRTARVTLCALGAAVIVGGGVLMALTVRPGEIAGVLLWLACAVLLHDGVLAALVLSAVLVARRAGTRVPATSLALIGCGLVVAAVALLLFLPEAYAKTLGPANPTVLPQDYLLHLVLFCVAIAASTLVAVLGYRILTRKRNARPSDSTDEDSANA
jgi:hypothetical protein